jgi:hypothetical protein
MSNEHSNGARMHQLLPGLVLAAVALAVVFASGALAHEPPIVSVGPVSSGGNTASGSVDSGGQASTCVNDQHSVADPAAAGSNSALKLNENSCQGAADSSAGTGSTGSTRSTAGTRSGTSSATSAGVASAQAVGLRIVRVRHLTKRVSATKRFRVVVTLRDLRGRLVRDAIVSVSRVPGAKNTISGVHSAFSNRLGQGSIGVPVTKRMFGKRLFLKVTARTAKARSVTLRSVHLPALG